MDMFDLAGTLFGNRRDPVAQGSTLTATGSTASADGTAYLVMDADVTPAEGVGDDTDQTVIDVPTSPSVAEGDEVIMTLVGDGPLKTPVVMANPGFGDRMQVQVDNAETLATEAQEVAEATGQHFWHDEQGVHVTEVTQDEWNDSTSPNYHSGANVLLNALGQLFRNRLNNLLTVLTSGIAIYDGNGNDSANILAEFTANRIRLGKKSSSGESTYAKVDFFDGDSSLASSVIPDGGEGVEGGRKNILLSNSYKLGELKAYGYHGISNQVTNDGQNTKEQAYSSMQAMTSDNSVYSSVGALVLRNNGGTPSSKITMHADYVDLSDNDTIKSVKMEQAIAAILRPVATYTGGSSTATDSATGWKLTWFNVALATNGPVGDYFTNANGVITAVRDCKLLISCVMRWQDSTAGQRGIGLFTRVNGGDSGGTEAASSFGHFSNTNNSNRTVYLPPRLFALSAGDHITVRRNTQANAKYTNGPNFSWLTVEVVG